MDLPRRLGARYELTELLGEGGSAQVFRARDGRTGREVAVKLLHPYLPEMERRRFEREIRTLSRLTHPGVVPVFDLGEEEGQLYFVMQLLTGGPISDLGPLEDQPVALGKFLDAAAFVAGALGYVHGQGVIHRDLTPNNILLGAEGLPRLMDFGLVSLGDVTRHLTRSGVTPGTPHYMAPEQARGGLVGPQSDLYALGAVLYRVACGSPPFVGESDQSILYQHVYEAPTHPQTLNPALPDSLAQLILTLLEKQPERRPASAAAVLPLIDLARQELLRTHSSGQFRGGRARAGEHLGGPSQPGRLRERWAVPLGGEVTWPSAVTAGRDLVAVGTRRRQLALISPGGKAHASLDAADEVTAPATFEAGAVLYGAWDGTLRKVELPGGQERWRHQTRAEITGAPTRWGDQYLISSRDGHLHAVGADRGELRWAYRAEGPVAASPLIWGGTVFLADEAGWVHALDAGSGTHLWRVQLDTVHATPAIAPLGRTEAALIVPTWKGELHALHLTLQDGRHRPHPEEPLLWTFDLEDEVWASPAVAGGLVYVATWGGRLHALDLRTADERWIHQLQGRVTASPVVSGAAVYAASEAGELLALSRDRGEVLWKQRYPVGVQATPLATDGTLYVAFMDGTLRAFGEAAEG